MAKNVQYEYLLAYTEQKNTTDPFTLTPGADITLAMAVPHIKSAYDLYL